MIPRFGDYEVLGPLGEGGMGLVFEAHDPSLQRSVAIKVLRANAMDPEGLARFKREAEVLGWLKHEGIAQIYQAGTQESEQGKVPFIAMELVRGERIDRYAERLKLGDVARIELILQLCSALHHAHQKGVVHRDLKPSNVLVNAAGRIKVLDFGVARLSHLDFESASLDPTRSGELLGTLPYMSPEQLGLNSRDVDTRSDVYALGVIAYELFTGSLPLDLQGLALPEAARRISEDEPTTLGQLDSRWKGDLEIIVGKALAKERERRYDSLEALGKDLQRFLAHEPIAARVPSRSYQLAKFARRNRGLVSGAALALLLLVVGASVSSVLFLQTSSVLRETSAEAETADETLRFLEEIFAESDPGVSETSVASVARRAVARLRVADSGEGGFVNSQLVRARLLHLLGSAFFQLELRSEAKPLLEEALELRREQFGEESAEVATSYLRMGQVRMDEALHAEALVYFQKALELRQRLQLSKADLAEAMGALAAGLLANDRAPEAEILQRETLALCLEVHGAAHPKTARARLAIGNRLHSKGELNAAEAIFREYALPEQESQDSGQRLVRIMALRLLSNTLRELRRETETPPLLREAVALSEEQFGPHASLTRNLRSTLAGHLASLGEYQEPIAIMRQIHREILERYGPDSPNAVSALHDLAYALHDQPDKTEAEDTYLEAIVEAERVLGPDASLVYQAQHNLALLYLDLQRFEEAEAFARESMRGRARVHGEAHYLTMVSRRGLGVILYRDRRYREAAELRRVTLELTLGEQGEASILTQDARVELSNALMLEGEFEESEALLLKAHQALQSVTGSESAQGRVRDALRRMYRAWKRPEEVQRWQEPNAAE